MDEDNRKVLNRHARLYNIEHRERSALFALFIEEMHANYKFSGIFKPE